MMPQTLPKRHAELLLLQQNDEEIKEEIAIVHSRKFEGIISEGRESLIYSFFWTFEIIEPE
jgi:hypothetical protein